MLSPIELQYFYQFNAFLALKISLPYKNMVSSLDEKDDREDNL